MRDPVRFDKLKPFLRPFFKILQTYISTDWSDYHVRWVLVFFKIVVFNRNSGNNATSCLLSSDVNDCATWPCNNGGVCRDLDGDYTCQCPSPYVGKQCQLRTFTKCNHIFSFHGCIISCHWFFQPFVFEIEQTTKCYLTNMCQMY